MQTTLQDLRYAVRSLLRAPGFAAVAILTLALGIGANTAVFTIVNALVLRPLPYPAADRLVMLWQDLRARGGPADEWASPGNVVDWRAQLPQVEGVAAIGGWRPTLTGDAEPEALTGAASAPTRRWSGGWSCWPANPTRSSACCRRDSAPLSPPAPTSGDRYG